MGDDLNNLDDEDGVAFPWALFAGFEGTVDVTVSTGGYSPGVLNAWLDFNMDGDWDDNGEQIASDVVLDDGTHTLAFDVPLTPWLAIPSLVSDTDIPAASVPPARIGPARLKTI